MIAAHGLLEPNSNHYPSDFLAAPLIFGARGSVEALAAVRLCGTFVQGAAFTAETELEAKKLALEDWTRQVSRLGPGFISWRLASEKRLACDLLDAKFVCKAVGRPCSVSQVVPEDSSRIRVPAR